VHQYYPFGIEQTSPAQDRELLKYTGHERDTPTLDYMHARYYGTEWGRFLSVDPMWESADISRPQTWKRYSYVLNNPISVSDPDGRVPTFVWWLLRTFGPPAARYAARETVVAGAQATRQASRNMRYRR